MFLGDGTESYIVVPFSDCFPPLNTESSQKFSPGFREILDSCSLLGTCLADMELEISIGGMGCLLSESHVEIESWTEKET